MIEPISHSEFEMKPKRSIWLPILGAGILATGGAVIYQGTQTEDLRRQFAAAQSDNAALRAKLADTDSDLQGALKSLREEFAESKQEASLNLAKAQTAASRHADLVAGKLAKQQAQQAQHINEEIGKVRESTLAASTRLDGITSTVGAVRNDVDGAKNDIQDTRSELSRARGDMGVMSGLIATNAKEIQALRDLGDRNIYEFTLARSAGMQKVGDISVSLKKADPKRNRFTLDVMADDRLVEKRDKNVNEPVQFYTSKAHQPYELVVNGVSKDKVTGYLATPKVTVARVTAAK